VAPSCGVHDRLLILDDEDILRKHLVRVFAREGFDVTAARTCAEATEALATRIFGALVLDIRLPDGNGLDLLAGLDVERRPALMVVVTAFSTPDNEIRAADLGVRRLL